MSSENSSKTTSQATDDQAEQLVNGMPLEIRNFLQAKACEKLQALITQVADDLAKMTTSELQQVKQQIPMQAARLSTIAKKQESVIRERRELATMLIMGALINQHNSSWDPQNPDTHQPSKGGLLGVLLNAQQPDSLP